MRSWAIHRTAEKMVVARWGEVRNRGRLLTCTTRCDKGVHEGVEIVSSCHDVVVGLDVTMSNVHAANGKQQLFLLLLAGLEHSHPCHWWLEYPSSY